MSRLIHALLTFSFAAATFSAGASDPFWHIDTLSPHVAPHLPSADGRTFRNAASASLAASVSGTVRDGDGAPAYAIIVIYDSSTKIVVGRAWTRIADGTYLVALPLGTYDFYVRQFGEPPMVVRGLTISGTTTRDFVMNGVAALNRFSQSSLANLVTFADGIDATTLELKSSTYLGSSINVFNEFGIFTVDGVHLGEITLHDDATHGDVTAYDRIYTRAGIGVGRDALYRCTIGGAPILFALTPEGIMRLPSIYLLGVEPAYRAAVTRSGDTQYTAHAANVIVAATSSDWVSDATHAFYRVYQDRYDILALFHDVFSETAYSIVVKNDVIGIGLPSFDRSSMYGSQGALQSLTLFSFSPEMPFLHEIAHRWGNRLEPLFDPDKRFGSHWGYAGVNGVLGGFDPNTLVAHGDGTYSSTMLAPWGWASDRPFSSLERYLAGFAPSDSVPPVAVFTNPQQQGYFGRFTADKRTEVTIDDVQRQFGARSPDFAQAPQQLTVAFVGVSARLLSQAEMTFLDRVARNYDGTSAEVNASSGCDPYRDSFSESTGGATLHTTILTNAPVNVRATASSTANVVIAWDPVPNATSYRVYRAESIELPFENVGTTTSTSFNDGAVPANHTYLYEVTSVSANGESRRSTLDFATTVLFTDDPLIRKSSILRAVHVEEIRTAVNAMRIAANLSPVVYADQPAAGAAFSTAQQLREIRSALDAARAAVRASPIVYTDGTLVAGSTPVRAMHWQELRDGCK